MCACGNTTDGNKAKTEPANTTTAIIAQDKSQAETTAASDKETSSAAEEVDYQYGVISIDVHYKFSKHFDDDWKLYGNLDPITSTEDNSCFLSIVDLCNEYNNLTVDFDKPDEWLDTVKDALAEKISNGAFYSMIDPKLDITKQELQEINGRTFVRFEGTFHNDRYDKDVAYVGYLTVIKGDPNLSTYKVDNTAGFMVAQDADKADLDELDAYAREAAETMAVGKDEWAKMK